MFSRKKTKPNLIIESLSVNDISPEELFDLIEKKNGDKIIEYINNQNYLINTNNFLNDAINN